MKKDNKLHILIWVISITAALTAATVSLFMFIEKRKKDERELEHYIDCSIQ